MKVSNKMISKIDEYLTSIGYEGLFSISDALVKRVTHTLDPKLSDRHKNKDKSSKSYKRAMEHSYQITRRDLLKVLWLRNGKRAYGISREYGYIYLVSNPAWPDKLKLGVTVDIPSRLKTYQTSSPFRDYEVVKYWFVKEPYKIERLILSSVNTMNEWVDKVDLPKIKEIISGCSAAW